MDRDPAVELWDGNTAEADSGRRVLVLPGVGYSVGQPGLAWPMRALALRSWQVWFAAWDMSRALTRSERQAIVDKAIERFLERSGGLPQLVLAKSIGTLAAGWVADHTVPAVWTTPLMVDDKCVENITRATAPAILVAGSQDPLWDQGAAQGTGKSVTLISGANHGWETGDWRTEMEGLGELVAAIDAFAATLHTETR